ncbi:MAG: hypothetical protein EZS28_030104, partial [Streblomastix strix]
SDLQNTDPAEVGVRLERINGICRKATAMKDGVALTVPLSKEIYAGIYKLNAKYDKCNWSGFSNVYVGIAKADYKIPYPCNPLNEPNRQNMLGYFGLTGNVGFNGKWTEGNRKFSDGQILTMELNMDAGTLHFFVDNEQQPVYVRGINDAVKFYGNLFYRESSFTVVVVKKLSIATVKKLPNEIAVEF